MKILLVHRLISLGDNQFTFGAVEYHRMQKPHHVMGNYTTIDSLERVEDNFIREFDLILFCRQIDNAHKTADRLNKIGIPFGVDIDDYWHLPSEHMLSGFYKRFQIPKLIESSIKLSHFVICTHQDLAYKIRQINPNVHVIENGIDTSDPVWQPNKTKSDRIRFGFTQGSTHIPDIMLINQHVSKAIEEFKAGQVVLCGFNADQEKGSIYVGYEKLLTNELKALKDPDYANELKLLGKPHGIDKSYRRIWGKDVDEFGSVYDEFDVSVAPLKRSLFNSCKSNLKMLEAGFKDCAIMLSEVKPYTPLANKKNAFLLSEKNFLEWTRYIIANPSIIQDKLSQLKEDVKPYSLQNLNNKRKEIYESCLCMQ